ncbi:MAG: hypothetical protein ACEPOZ_17655 [Marinifilaceae bacterium]
MNQAQRKRHLISWLLLALLLPIGFAAAIWVIPQPIHQEEIFRKYPEALPEVISWKSSDNLVAALRADTEREDYQLEIIVTKPFQHPNILVYLYTNAGDNPENQILLGSLNSKGSMRFPIPLEKLHEARATVGFYDPYGKVLISIIQFKL